jgi:hypothetical protein
MKEAHTKTDGVEARAKWVVCCDEKARQEWRSKLVVDNPDFLFLVPSQRLKRLNHHPEWRAPVILGKITMRKSESRALQFR